MASLRYLSCSRLIILHSPRLCSANFNGLDYLGTALLLMLKGGVTPAADAHFRAVRQRRVPGARVLAASGANQHDVRNVERAFLLENAALDVLRRIRPRVALDNVRVLDRHPALRRVD